MKIDEKVTLLESSPYFDSNWYESQYPDVAQVKMSAALHYLKYGWRMGRAPSPRFDGEKYLAQYPDVAEADQNPLLHYLRYGKKEGREIWEPQRQATARATAAVPATGCYQRGESVGRQLEETQQLLEHYFNRARELEFRLLDQQG